MPTKQELKKFIDEVRSTLPILAVGSQVEYAYGVNMGLKLIEDEFNLNNLGENVEG